MSAGEGIFAFLLFVAVVFGGCGFLLVHARTPALPGEPPSWRGHCRCRACRERPQEPCSDYGGD